MTAVGVTEILILALALLGGLGLPAGIPPLPTDATIEKAAPPQCLAYLSLAGLAEPNASSANHTETILAHEEVRDFARQVDVQIQSLIRQAAAKNPRFRPWAESGPGLVRLLLTRPAALALERVEVAAGGQPEDVALSLIVHCGPRLVDAKRWLQQVEDLASQNLPPGSIRELSLGRDQFRQVVSPTGVPLSWGYRGDYFIFTVGKRTLNDLLTRIDQGNGPPPWLADLKKKFAVPRVSAIGYCDVGQVLATARPHIREPKALVALEALGLDKIKTVGVVQGLDADAMVLRKMVETEEGASGLLELLAAKPLSIAELRGIPKDATMAVAARCDLADFYRRIQEIVGKIEPGAAEQMRSQAAGLKQALGIDLEQDLLAALGDVWIGYGALDGGLTGWTNIAVTASIRDKARLEATHQKLLQLAAQLQASGQVTFAIRPAEISGTKAWQLVFSGPVPVSPAWCLLEDRLVIGASVEAVKGQLAQAKRKTALVDQPDVARYLKQGAALFAYQDTRASMRSLVSSMQFVGPMISNAAREQGIEFTLPPMPSLADLDEHLTPQVVLARRVKTGIVAEQHQSFPAVSANPGTTGVMVALLLPAIQAAREAARRTASSNNLRQIGIAMHNHHDAQKRLPGAALRSKDGRPLLSWRVALLPYLEQESLYKQFHLDEPWDSEHNRQLIAKMPAVYQNPSSALADQGLTVYLAPAGKGTLFEKPQGAQFKEVLDGLSNTIVVVEANDEAAVVWTQPHDLEYDAGQPLKGLGSAHPGGFLALFGDAAVHFFSAGIDPATLSGAMTPAGGEAIAIPR